MTAAPKCSPSLKLHYDGSLVCRTSLSLGKADAFREETSRCTGEALRGRGSKHLYKDCGDNVGKGHLAAGTDVNLQRLTVLGTTEVGERDLVWRMSPYER